MSSSKRVRLVWSGEALRFTSRPEGGREIVLDGDGEQGPSPMDALLLSLAGCMAVDVRMILEKSRVPLHGLEVEAMGERAEESPRRYTRIRLVYHLAGPSEEDRSSVQRAVDLSRERYCSVLHTLRPDLEVEIEIHQTS